MSKSEIFECNAPILNASDTFLQVVVEKMSTMLTPPESHLIRYGDKANDMFIVVQGDCTIDLPNE